MKEGRQYWLAGSEGAAGAARGTKHNGKPISVRLREGGAGDGDDDPEPSSGDETLTEAER